MIKTERLPEIQPAWVQSVLTHVEAALARVALEVHTAWCSCPSCRAREHLCQALWHIRRITRDSDSREVE